MSYCVVDEVTKKVVIGQTVSDVVYQIFKVEFRENGVWTATMPHHNPLSLWSYNMKEWTIEEARRDLAGHLFHWLKDRGYLLFQSV